MIRIDKNSIEVSWNLPRVYEKIARRRNISYLPASEFARPGEADQNIWMNWDIADLQMQFMKSLQDEA